MKDRWIPKDLKPGAPVYLPFIGLEDPDHPQNKGKKYMEVKAYQTPEGHKKKAIFIDGVMLDYEIDLTEYFEASKMGLKYKRSVQRDIAKHFVECVSEMVGRKVTVDDLVIGQLTGWI